MERVDPVRFSFIQECLVCSMNLLITCSFMCCKVKIFQLVAQASKCRSSLLVSQIFATVVAHASDVGK